MRPVAARYDFKMASFIAFDEVEREPNFGCPV